MIRLASWIVLSLLITAAIAWLTSLPGTMTIELLGYRLQPRLGVAAFLLLGVIAAMIIAWSIVRRIVTAPRFLAKRAEARRKEQGVEALGDGYIALEAGDYGRARMLAREARTNLPRNEAAQLLEARADLALGDMSAAREHYRALISNRKTALAALSGLYEQARQQSRPEVALTFAKKAVLIAPDAGWANAAVFDDLGRRGQWVDALAMVARGAGGDARGKAQEAPAAGGARDGAGARGRGDRSAGGARSCADGAEARARVRARGADRGAHPFRPRRGAAGDEPSAPGVAGDAASRSRDALCQRRSPGVSAVERLRRLRELIEIPAPDRASAVVLARAAVDAYEWSTARNALAAYHANPSQAVCLLLAEIEEGQNGDQGKAREWLARAVRAPRDAAWTAEGIVFDEWEPVSPVNGKLDALQWKVPAEAPGARHAEAPRSAEATALVVADSENPGPCAAGTSPVKDPRPRQPLASAPH